MYSCFSPPRIAKRLPSISGCFFYVKIYAILCDQKYGKPFVFVEMDEIDLVLSNQEWNFVHRFSPTRVFFW